MLTDPLLTLCIMDFQKGTEVMFGKIQQDLGQTVNPARKEPPLGAPGCRKAGSHQVGDIQTTGYLCSSSGLWFQARLKHPICLLWECSRSSGLTRRTGTEKPDTGSRRSCGRAPGHKTPLLKATSYTAEFKHSVVMETALPG